MMCHIMDTMHAIYLNMWPAFPARGACLRSSLLGSSLYTCVRCTPYFVLQLHTPCLKDGGGGAQSLLWRRRAKVHVRLSLKMRLYSRGINCSCECDACLLT